MEIKVGDSVTTAGGLNFTVEDIIEDKNINGTPAILLITRGIGFAYTADGKWKGVTNPDYDILTVNKA